MSVQDLQDTIDQLRLELAQAQIMWGIADGLLKAMKRGDCWCEVATGNPMMQGRHSLACLETQRYFKENQCNSSSKQS